VPQRPTDESIRQNLLKLLETEPPDEERLLAQFEEYRRAGQPVYACLLSILTHLGFGEAEAYRHWRRIQAHRDRLRSALRRDVGLRVALLDYFVNVNRELHNPKVIEIAIYERTERSAVTDGLTGLFNHAYLIQALKREVLRARRHDLKLSVAMFDLDDFKRVNDTRGHLEGDRILMKTAAVIRESLREIDTPARYGGEEFAILLPETSRAGAHVVADRIRRRVEERLRARDGGGETISGGVATYPEDATSPEELLRRADEGLYRAKADGKNRITMVGGERRRHFRVPVSHPLLLRARSKRRAARVENVSAGGLLVSLHAPVPVGSHVTLVIRPAGVPSMALRGVVVRVEKAGHDRRRSYEVGVRLVGESTDALAVLQRSAPPGPDHIELGG
jgi:diguanylate cyclase (GGDEF)-like protein